MAKAGSSARLTSQFNGTYNKTGGDGGDIAQSFSVDTSAQYADGNDANQFNRYVAKKGTANDVSAKAIDFSGTTTDGFADATDFTKVREIIVKNTGTTNDLLVGGGSNPLTDVATQRTIKPGGSERISAPGAAAMAVTAATGDALNVVCTTGLTTTYEVYAWGSA